MLTLTVTLTAKTQDDLELALDEIQRLVGEGYTSILGQEGMSFSVDGAEESE